MADATDPPTPEEPDVGASGAAVEEDEPVPLAVAYSSANRARRSPGPPRALPPLVAPAPSKADPKETNPAPVPTPPSQPVPVAPPPVPETPGATLAAAKAEIERRTPSRKVTVASLADFVGEHRDAPTKE